MAALALLLLGCVFNVWAQSTGGVEVERNVTGVLGEEVMMRCLYTGQEEIIMSSWSMKEGLKSKRLAGYHHQPFANHKDFSLPVSPSNLTVSVLVTSLATEKEYWCAFHTLEGEEGRTVFLTVLVRPEVHTNVEETVENGTHYQMASCSAIAGKPAAVVSWSIDGGDHTEDGAFPVSETTTLHHNGTSTQTSVLRLPTHLLQSAEVTCVIRHPALPQPILETVRVQIFVAPNVTLQTRSADEGVELQEVSCLAAGARPTPKITWLLPGDMPEGSPVVREWWDKETNTVTVASSVSLHAHLYEGKNVTCTVTHPKLPGQLQQTITLPIYELSAVRVLRQDSAEMYPGDEVEGPMVLTEGQKNVSFSFEVAGNVPHYRVTCARENGSLPEGVEVTGSVLHFEGPIEALHAGLYTCQASYYSYSLSVPLEIVVTPTVVLPVVVPPSIKLQTREDVDHRIVECSASNAFPEANVSWILPKALSGTIQANSTFQNGAHSVTSVLRLPACLPQERTVECVITHPALMTSETRPMTLPVCVSPNISISSHSEWEEGTEYTEVECSVDSGGHSATISWSVEDGDCDDCPSGGNQAQQDGSKLARSLLRLPTRLIAGRVIACLVDHPALSAPVRRELRVPSTERASSPSPQTLSPVPVVFVGPLKASALWLAVCEVRGAATNVSISWVLPKKSTGRTMSHSGYEEEGLWAKSSYKFPLAQHEGKNLTCLMQDEHSTKKMTLHVPQFYISSLRVLNKTASYRGALEEGPVRAALQARKPGQRILLKAYGNVPQQNITCTRSDGSAAQMEGSEMVFASEASEQDAGLYTCHASFYHHRATVLVQVEVTSDDLQLWLLVLICFSSAGAVSLIVLVSLCVFCKRTDDGASRSKASHKKRESLAALTSLMLDPCSPELKKPVAGRKNPEYAELVRYSIVSDVKTTV